MELEFVKMLLGSGGGAFVGWLMYKLATKELKEVKVSNNNLENAVIKFGMALENFLDRMRGDNDRKPPSKLF